VAAQFFYQGMPQKVTRLRSCATLSTISPRRLRNPARGAADPAISVSPSTLRSEPETPSTKSSRHCCPRNSNPGGAKRRKRSRIPFLVVLETFEGKQSCWMPYWHVTGKDARALASMRSVWTSASSRA